MRSTTCSWMPFRATVRCTWSASSGQEEIAPWRSTVWCVQHQSIGSPPIAAALFEVGMTPLELSGAGGSVNGQRIATEPVDGRLHESGTSRQLAPRVAGQRARRASIHRRLRGPALVSSPRFNGGCLCNRPSRCWVHERDPSTLDAGLPVGPPRSISFPAAHEVARAPSPPSAAGRRYPQPTWDALAASTPWATLLWLGLPGHGGTPTARMPTTTLIVCADSPDGDEPIAIVHDAPPRWSRATP
jgi:hypothetical protein